MALTESSRIDIQIKGGSMMAAFEGMYEKTVSAAEAIMKNQGNGMYLISCPTHCILHRNCLWNNPLQVNGTNLHNAVSSWWAGNETHASGNWSKTVGQKELSWKWLDCAWPCNGSCPPVPD